MNQKWKNTLGIASEEDQGRGWWKRSINSVNGEPLPYLTRESYNYMRVSSGIGVLVVTILLWMIGITALLVPFINSKDPYWLMLFAIPTLPFAIYFDYQGIRRMIWEHRNGGIWHRSKSDLQAFFWVLIIFAVSGVYSLLTSH